MEPTTLIRPAGVADFDAWFTLFDAVASEGIWLGSEGPLDRAQRHATFLQSVEGPASVTLLAERGDALVGLLGVGVAGGVADLGMAVAAAARGSGVGSLLLTACIDWSAAHGAHKVSLQVWPHNARAIALYRRHGFEVEGRLRRHYRRRSGELWDALVMGLVLDHDSPGSPHPEGTETGDTTEIRG